MFQDWFTELVSVVKDILIGLSALAVPAIAAVGLRQWRAELRGNAEFDLARRIALLAFEFRDDFDIVRDPVERSWESANRPREDDENSQLTTTLDSQFARSHRLQRLRNVTRKLHEARWEADVILASSAAALIAPLVERYRHLFADVNIYFDMQLKAIRNPMVAATLRDTIVQVAVNVSGTPEDDVSKAMSAEVDALVHQLRPYIKK